MKNEKPSLIEERHFPFECGDSIGVEENFQTLHWHQEIEICFIKNGSGKYLINGVVYPFSKGDIFIISNEDIHMCYEDSELIMQVVMFAPHFIQSDYSSMLDFEYRTLFLNGSKKIGKNDPYHHKLSGILTEIEEEYNKKQNEFSLMIKALLLQFIAVSIRSFNECDKANTGYSISANAVKIIRSVINELEKNYAEMINLDTIAKKYNISIPYLCSCFKKLTGSTPNNFLIRKRIAASKQMLSLSDKSILDVSHECGFQSLSNFNHLFKDFVGCTPSTYRKNRKI